MAAVTGTRVILVVCLCAGSPSMHQQGKATGVELNLASISLTNHVHIRWYLCLWALSLSWQSDACNFRPLQDHRASQWWWEAWVRLPATPSPTIITSHPRSPAWVPAPPLWLVSWAFIYWITSVRWDHMSAWLMPFGKKLNGGWDSLKVIRNPICVQHPVYF